MADSELSMAQQIAAAAHDFQLASTGRSPASITVVLSQDTLVITLHEALSAAEKAIAQTPDGAAQVQEFHRQLFLSSVGTMRMDIQRITGVAVREAAVEVETRTGTVVHALTSGTVVHVFQLAGVIPADQWKADGDRRPA
jgi:uncharacterized protein YbcI